MRQQHGGTFLGFILGLVVGLASALAVAVYVTKVPVPFVSKAVSRSPDQDASEQQKNKGWDPNAPLYGKNPAKPDGPAEQVERSDSSSPTPATAASASKAQPAKPAASARPELKPAVTADPLGDLARVKIEASNKTAAAAAGEAADPFTYFVQVGAFRSAEDAETQHARLSLAGIETAISQREERGQMMHRVRVGPFETREAAEKAKQKLGTAGVETALVRVQR